MSRLLIVDDEPQNLYMLTALLQGNGHQVSAAANGLEALAAARVSPPDLVISDILMPVMDGFSFCREWKRDSRLGSIPFVFYSATYTDPKDEEFAMSLGAEMFIRKPQDPDVFIKLLNKVIQERETKKIQPPVKPIASEKTYFKKYNAALIRKLEDKLAQLQEANRLLGKEIAERKQVEAALRSSEARLAQAQRVARLGNWDLVPATGELYWSDEVYRIFGRERGPAGIDYRTFLQAIHPSDRAAFQDRVSTAAERNAPCIFDHRIVLPDGGERIIHEEAYIIPGNGEKAVRLIGTIQDVTERRLAESALREREEQLRQAHRLEAIGRLAGGVAHDFNNLLTVISGNAEMIGLLLGEGASGRSELEAIRGAASEAAQLTGQLLAFSREQVLQRAILDCNQAINGMEKILKSLIGPGIKFETSLDPALEKITADKSQLQQVLMNLTVNARDAMSGEGTLTVRTRNTSWNSPPSQVFPEAGPGRYVLLEVEDTGTGISEEALGHIFEPFYSTKGPEKGTGLGLSIVYGIVRRHGGWLEVSSRPGWGSVFRIYFPAATARLQTPGEDM